MSPSNRSKQAVVALLVAVLFGSISGISYWRYKEKWIRLTPSVPKCVMKAQMSLSKGASESTSNPYAVMSGDTVQLTTAELSAVQCVEGISKDFASDFAIALVEQQPEARAKGLLRWMQAQYAKGSEADAQAVTSYYLSMAALHSVNKEAGVPVIQDQMREINACRFYGKQVCPTRPPFPWIIWGAGSVSGVGIIALLVFIMSSLIPKKKNQSI